MDRFKEGWIQINRPFDVSILKYPLQKFSIFFRYHYGFKYKEELMYKGGIRSNFCRAALGHPYHHKLSKKCLQTRSKKKN